MKMKKKANRRKRKKRKVTRLSSYQRGLKIGCINVRGLVSYPVKRIDLNNWLRLHNLDAVCIQEWYVPQQKKNKKKNKNKNDKKDNDRNENDNNHDYDYENDDDNNNDNNNEMNQLAPLKVSLDMTSLTEYEKVECNNKTIIVYKKHWMSLDLTILMKLKKMV